MLGAILGDMIGAPYEFDRGDKTKDFPLFSKETEFTDDSVMTIAVAEAQLDHPNVTPQDFINSMQKWGHMYPYAGYGAMFIHWLAEKIRNHMEVTETDRQCGFHRSAGCMMTWKLREELPECQRLYHIIIRKESRELKQLHRPSS